jgi:hypothetical protein
MNIEDLIIKEAKELAALFGAGSGNAAKPHPYKIGQNYLIRTVTMIDIGKLIWVGDHEIVLEDASWIPQTETWSECLTTGKCKEVEPNPEGETIIGRGAIIDAVIWSHPIPRKQKG